MPRARCGCGRSGTLYGGKCLGCVRPTKAQTTRGTRAHGDAPPRHAATVTIAFQFDEYVSDIDISKAVLAAAPLFPHGTFTIVAIDRAQRQRSREN